MAPPDNHQERRHFSRIPIDFRARLSCDGWQGETYLHDISLNGALLHTPEGCPDLAGSHCRLELTLNGSEQTILMEGQVVHQHEESLGFHCQQIDLQSISRLKRLLELNMGEEELLERELHQLLEGSSPP